MKKRLQSKNQNIQQLQKKKTSSHTSKSGRESIYQTPRKVIPIVLELYVNELNVLIELLLYPKVLSPKIKIPILSIMGQMKIFAMLILQQHFLTSRLQIQYQKTFCYPTFDS